MRGRRTEVPSDRAGGVAGDLRDGALDDRCRNGRGGEGEEREGGKHG